MVEIISDSGFHCYQEMLDQIDGEYEESEKLKKAITLENNKIIISHLANSEECHTISLVLVKVFNDLFEIYKLYHSDLSKNTVHKLIQYEGYKFYLIEIHIANSIQKKISEFECGIGICVRGTNILINRTVQYKNVSPIIEIVPVEETIVDCIVETYLILQFNNSLIKLDLQTVVLDISYHFHTFLENSKSNNLNKKILQINKHYNQSDIDQLRRPILTENVFHSQITSEELIKLFLNHSYHLLDIDLFSEFTNNDLNAFSVYFSTGYNKHLLTFDPKNKKIIISCNIDDMLILKSHFIKGCLKAIAANKKTEGEIQSLSEKLANSVTVNDVCLCYKKAREYYAVIFL